MSDINPYAPPQSDPSLPPAAGVPLATPWVRLGSAIVDGLVLAAIIVPLQWLSGSFQRNMARAQSGEVDFVASTLEGLLWAAIAFVIYLIINWAFLQNGQTIAKKLLKLQIQRKDGSKIPALRIVTHRILPVNAAQMIPFIGGFVVLLDALLIFRSGRNTLHDDIADTRVVQLPG